MNMIHDYEIKGYSIDFEEKKVVLKITNDVYHKKIVFSDVFTHHFVNEMPYSIILDLEERKLERFFSDNQLLLEKGEKKGWPIMTDSLQKLKTEIASNDLHYYILFSSYGMSGWVLSESYEVITVED